MKNKKNLLVLVVTGIVLFFAIFSCSDDDDTENSNVNSEYLKAAKSILQDSIVLNATAMMGTVNKTCLETGCPLKYFFEWRGYDSLNIQLRAFSVGKMPVTIWFSVNVKFMNLNSWEQNEYTDEGWIKFKGSGGITNYTGDSDDYEDGSGGSGSVKGYYNAKNNEIEFVTSFNVMNMSADVFQQKIDLTRMPSYDADFAQYEQDLIQCKEDKGW